MRVNKLAIPAILAVLLLGAVMFVLQSAKPASSQLPPPPPLTLEYSAKFLCGLIEQLDPPLGQGEYHTVINVLNPDESEYQQPRKFTWKAVHDDGRISRFRERSLEPNAATEIDCADIRSALGIAPLVFIKGFVVIKQTIPMTDPPPDPQPKFIQIEPAYTFEATKNKIIFEVTSDPSGLVPPEDLNTHLEIIAPVGHLTTVLNVRTLVRSHLKVIKWHGLTDAQIDALTINILDVQLGVGASLQVGR